MILSGAFKAHSDLAPAVMARAHYLFEQDHRAICTRTDRLFAALLILQWLGAILWSCLASPRSWVGTESSIHIHVWQSVLLGALLLSLPLLLVWRQPAAPVTRYVIAVAQMLSSGLLIAASNGRIETHFHVFGSLAFLAFYRDWRVLIIASSVTMLDHLIRGIYAPATMYGVSYPEPWRWVEHSAWVVFCVVFLELSIRYSLRDMKMVARRQAELEAAKNSTEQEVIARTSELRQSEQNLRDSEATIRAIFETAADSIFTISEEGTIETANHACEVMFAYQFHQLFGKHVSFLIQRFDEETCCPDTWPQLRERARMRRENALRIEGVGKSRIRGSFPIEISLSYVDLKGRKLITAIIRDITERREAEKRVSEFYSIVSHELRTPLTSIRGSLGLVEGGVTGELPDETKELVGIARESCDRLIRLINDILDLKKLESGKFEFQKLELSPAELLAMAISYTDGMAREREVRLEIGWTTKKTFLADADRINQVLVNLISNAIKFSPRNSSVELSCTFQDSEVRFAVRDHGKGIPASEQHKLFHKFQQLDASDQRTQEGTGLGLAICKAIVEQHHGKIGVESESGGGSTFWFSLPVAFEDDFAGNADGEPASLLLVIEESKDISELLGSHLLPAGCRVKHVKNSSEAATVIAQSLPDLVIFNSVSPNESDFELQEKLRELNVRHGKPVLMLATDGLKSAPILFDWHTSPVKEEQVLDGVRRALDRNNCPAVLVVEDDFSTRKTLVLQLESHGVRCIEAADGSEALQMLASESPQLIILDVGLPGMDGFEFVKHLKEGESRLTPVLVYTGRDLSSDERKMLTIGFTRYLTKSKASQEELLQAVDELLQQMHVHKESAGD
ncbi:MAG: response regulator [Candidatus Obscuribacterales bacterium]|nr:response regulator [Candidatus Obscuribacterales bacterium]